MIKVDKGDATGAAELTIDFSGRTNDSGGTATADCIVSSRSVWDDRHWGREESVRAVGVRDLIH